MLPRWRRNKLIAEINPDEIFMDSSNSAGFDRDQFEGRIEQPLGRRTLWVAGACMMLICSGLLFRAGQLQIVYGSTYAERARDNQLAHKVIFADRGILADRTGKPLAYNDRASVADDFAKRVYAPFQGLAHAVGYVKPPAKDASGHYFRDAFVGLGGAERAFNTALGGTNGLKLSETDAHGTVVSESVVQPAEAGQKITLSLDAAVTEGLYKEIARVAEESRFQGGAGVVMDVQTGELLALTSFPEYNQNALVSGDSATVKALNSDKRQPFLNRAVAGLYSPGSIVKPVVAAAALNEGIIDEFKSILSTGAISIPNPYDASRPTVFRDWKAHGWVDMREAIAVSSDVYFYAVGGGFEDQKGLGIANLDKYFTMFGFGKDPGLVGFPDQAGNIPTPAWKATTFPDDPMWRVGNTYHTAIGQYGMQVTPLQAVRQTAALANGGKLLTPTLLASTTLAATSLPVSPHALQVAREGMRQSVVTGIAQGVNVPWVEVAAKTGTAQVGVRNEYMNSWMIGFFPYEKPRYAYAVVLERGPAGTSVGASAVMGAFVTWLRDNAPQYLK